MQAVAGNYQSVLDNSQEGISRAVEKQTRKQVADSLQEFFWCVEQKPTIC